MKYLQFLSLSFNHSFAPPLETNIDGTKMLFQWRFV